MFVIFHFITVLTHSFTEFQHVETVDCHFLVWCCCVTELCWQKPALSTTWTRKF